MLALRLCFSIAWGMSVGGVLSLLSSTICSCCPDPEAPDHPTYGQRSPVSVPAQGVGMDSRPRENSVARAEALGTEA